MKELTVRAVLLGLVLSVVMGAANVYLGLKVGMTVSASIPAAVLAMLILRALSGSPSILEANQVQTAASAGESLAAGIIFTMPALLLIGVWQEFHWLTTTLVAFSGGLLGILFMIPMRRVFVTNSARELHFPEGVACAAVLQAGQQSADRSGALRVVYGGVLGLGLKLGSSFLGVFQSTLEGAAWLGGRVLYLGGDVSAALVGVGYIVRLQVAVLIFAGGALSWLVAIPILSTPVDGSALDVAWELWSTKARYVGVGAMVVGGIASIVKVRTGLVDAVRVLVRPRRNVESSDRDLPGVVIAAVSAVTVLIVAGLYYSLTHSVAITLPITAIMIVMAFFFTAVASYIVGLVGNSNSPVSGMTITAVLFTGGMLYVLGFAGVQGMVATLGVAAVVCCAACTSGDVCNDLKTGQIVGASPFRQQLMQIGGVAVASLVMAPVLQVLHDNTPGGIGGRDLAAPQAQLFASLAQGFFGEGQLPWTLAAVGAGLGVAILALDTALERAGSGFRAHLMPIAVGMYLPFGIAIPMLLGGLIAHFVAKGQRDEQAEVSLRSGTLLASGVIAGESLMGVGIALLFGLGVTAPSLGLSSGITAALTAVEAVGILVFFWLLARPRRP